MPAFAYRPSSHSLNHPYPQQPSVPFSLLGILSPSTLRLCSLPFLVLLLLFYLLLLLLLLFSPVSILQISSCTLPDFIITRLFHFLLVLSSSSSLPSIPLLFSSSPLVSPSHLYHTDHLLFFLLSLSPTSSLSFLPPSLSTSLSTFTSIFPVWMIVILVLTRPSLPLHLPWIP